MLFTMFFTKKSEKGASLKYLKKIRKKVNNKNNRHRKNSRDIWQRRGWLNWDNGREKNNYFSNFQHFVKWSLSKKQEILLNFWVFFQCCQRQSILPCKTSREVIFFSSFLDWDYFNDDQEFQIWEWKKKNNSRAFLYNSNN